MTVKVVKDGGLTFVCEPDEIAELCDAKIISYEYGEPIKNTFSK